MGYVLSGGTAQQKIFMLVGPKRSGKGTILRVLTALLGVENVAAPTLSSLATNFGLQPLVGKPLAAISDARLGTRSDALVAVERLLSISGEDAITVDRKYRDPWTGRLPTRFVVLTNEIPHFKDASGALAGRFVILALANSFYGHEDITLTNKLLDEASGIFNWSLEGLDRLASRGHFIQPTTAENALRHLEDLASPVSAFVRDRCTVGGELVVAKDELWKAWREWCSEEGAQPGTRALLVRDLRAAVPGALPQRPRRSDGTREHVIAGLALGEVQTTVPNTPDHPDHEDFPVGDLVTTDLAQPSGSVRAVRGRDHCKLNWRERCPRRGRDRATRQTLYPGAGAGRDSAPAPAQWLSSDEQPRRRRWYLARGFGRRNSRPRRGGGGRLRPVRSPGGRRWTA